MQKFNIVLFLFTNFSLFSQAPNFDLLICRSSDGVNWTDNDLFEATAGVPSAIQHTSGVIYCVFQWFPAPNSPTNTAFDKIAIKQSPDGVTWSSPQTINFIGYPPTYKRPFDPTIVVADDGRLRLYFSASKNGMLPTLDSTVHTYSAISPDGINFTFEGVRVLVKDSINIDPAVAKFGSVWHYTCPRAGPQAGAYHFISSDGLAWTRTATVASDMNHNWTGNLLQDGSTLKFCGTPNPQTNAIWTSETSNGYYWSPYLNCIGPITTIGIQADPTVVKTGSNNYIMIYVSKQTLLAIDENEVQNIDLNVYPNPSTQDIKIESIEKIKGLYIFDNGGKLVFQDLENSKTIRPDISRGSYTIKIITEKGTVQRKLLIE